MIGLLCFFLSVLASPFKSTFRLEPENAVLRHQLNVLRRNLHRRVRLTNHDRLFFIQLYRWFPAILRVLTIIRPETLVRWHRAGFRCYWRWKSRPQGGRPRIDAELRVLIQRMRVESMQASLRNTGLASCIAFHVSCVGPLGVCKHFTAPERAHAASGGPRRCDGAPCA